MSCPNKNSRQFKDLVDAVGEANAMVVFKLNNDDIPSVEKAKELLGPQVSDEFININTKAQRELGYRAKELLDSHAANSIAEIISIDPQYSGWYARLIPSLDTSTNNIKYKVELHPNSERTTPSKSLDSKESVDKMMSSLMDKFEGVSYIWIKPSDLVQSEHNVSINSINAFVKGKTVHLVEGRVNNNTAIEELLHPFVEGLFNENRSVFLGLLKEAGNIYPDMVADIRKTYSRTNTVIEEDIKKEIVTRALQQALKDDLANNPERKFDQIKYLLSRFLNWLSDILNNVFGIDMDRYKVKLYSIPSSITLSELASVINTEKLQLETNFINSPAYNLSEMEQDDEMFGSRQKNIVRIETQINMLDSIMSGLTEDDDINKLQTLTTLQDKLKEHLEDIKSGKTTISVTKLKGGGALDLFNQNPKFQNFGTFLHDGLELLQREYLDDPSILPSRRINEEFIDKLLKNQMDKLPEYRFTVETGSSSDITDLNKKEVLAMMRSLLQTYESYIIQGYTIIPEITIAGMDKSGRTVIGRIDTLAIHKDGSVKIIDLKTKKLNEETAWDKINAQLERTYRIEASADSDADFFLTPQMANRNAYQEWDIQLGIYEQIFKQMGIDVSSKEIIGLLYMGINDFVPVKDSLTNAYDFKYKSFMIINHISGVNSYQSLSDRLSFEKYQETVKKVVPVKEATLEEKKQKANVIFDLTEDQQNNILARLKDVIDNEIGKVTSTITKYRKEGLGDSEMVKSLSEKNETLKKVRDTMNKENWDTAYKLSLTLQFLDESYDNLTKTISEIKKIDNNQEKARQLDALRRRATGLNYFIDELERALISVDPTLNKEAISIIGRIKSNMQSVLIAYNELGADFMIKIVQSMQGTRRETVMSKQREEAIKPRLEYLKQKLDRLKSGSANITDVGSNISYLFLGSIKNMIRGIQKIPGQELNLIKDLEAQIKKLELELEGIKLESPEELKKFIEGVLENKNSLLYLGQGVSPISDIIAAASNSDLGISSFANFLKAVQQDAQKEYLNFIERNKFQDEIDAFSGGNKDMNEVSKRLTEVRTIKEIDDEGNETEREVLSFIDPIQKEYRNTFDEHYATLREINQEIKNAPNESKRREAVKKRAEIVESHRKWRLEHSQMPLKDEVYKLENLLPAEYRQRRTEILDEINAIKLRPGYNNEELLTDEDRSDIAELEVELQRLKIDMLKGDTKYADYIEKLDMYYTYETNWNFFNRMKNSKMIQYGENSEEFRKWMDENTIKVANSAYYEELEEIFEEMFSILDKDDEMEDVRKQQRELLQKVKRKGYADVRFLTDEEKEEYMQLDALMAEMREDKVRVELDSYDRDRLSELRMRLNSIRTYTTNPYYQMEYSSRKQALDQKYSLYKQAEEELASSETDQNKRNLDMAINNYYDEEGRFEEWYNKNHYDIYESRLIAEKPLNPKPLPFNVISIPTNEKHFDQKPISKYSIRKIKDTAKNKDYQEDVYGVPMPRSLKRDNTTGEISIVDESSKWINPSYRLLSKNPLDFKFYNFLVNKFIQTQGETYGHKLGYLVPGYEEMSIKIYQERGVKEGVKQNFNIWKEKNFSIDSPYSYNINEYSADLERTRFKFNRPLPINEQSQNAIGCVIKWYEEAFINKHVSQAQPEVNAAISYMESIYSQLENSNVPDKELRKKELQKTIGVMKSEYNKIIKGETKENEGQLGRIGDLILRGLGMSRMGLDVPNQIGNLFSGNVQIFLGGHKTGQYNNQDLIWSKKKIWGRNGLMNSLVDDISKISGKSFMTNMYLYFNPMQQSVAEKVDKSMSRNERVKESLLDLEFAFWIQDKGEVEIASTIWLSMMNNRKVEMTMPDGSKTMIPLFEAYESNANNEIVIKQNVNWTKADENEFFRNLYSEIRRTQGNYAGVDKTKVEQNILGRYGMFFRKYLAPAIQNRFGPRRENHEGSEIAMGYYNGLIHAIKYYGIKEVFLSLFKKDTKVSDFYRQRSMWAARELAVSTALIIIGNMLASLVSAWGDDDDEITVPKVLVYNMLAVFLKVERETRGLVPLPGIGGFEGYLTQLSSFTNAGSDFVKVGKTVVHGLSLAAAQISDSERINKSAYYQAKSGYFEEGEAKVKKDLMDVFSVSNVYNIFHPVSPTKQGFKMR